MMCAISTRWIRTAAATLALATLVVFAGCSRQAGSPGPGVERDRFLAVKRLVFDRQWDGVRAGMERYLADYPSGAARDEALYWLARSLDAKAGQESDRAQVIRLERLALDRIDALARTFPRSPWRGDAGALRVQIASRLVALGETQFQPVVLDALTTPGDASAEGSSAGHAALDALAALRPDVAREALTRVVRSDGDMALRRKALVLLGSTALDTSVPVLEEVMRSDRNAALRALAHDVLGRVATATAPVALAYTVRDGRVTDRSLDARIPEGRITTFTVSPAGTTAEGSLERAMERLLGRTLSLSKNVAQASDTGDPFQSAAMVEILARSTIVLHKMGGFTVAIVPGSVRKTTTGITGQARFDELVSEFQVGSSADVVLATRRSDQVALLCLRFAPKAARATGEQAEDTNDREKVASEPAAGTPTSTDKPVYCSTFNYGPDLVVRTTRCSWAPEELAANVMDFSRAVAEIRAAGGRWVLSGHLQMLRSSKVFVARGATLIGPAGTTPITADELTVPYGPAAFTIGSATRR
jgi:hypothetical protein